MTKDINEFNYRQHYFQHNKPIEGKYICAYCNRLFRKITVDHIIPQDYFRKIESNLRVINILSIIIFIGITTLFVLEKKEVDVYLFIYCFLSYSAIIALSQFFVCFEHSRYNLVGACMRCNRKKSNKIDSRVLIGTLMRIGGRPAYFIRKYSVFWLIVSIWVLL